MPCKTNESLSPTKESALRFFIYSIGLLIWLSGATVHAQPDEFDGVVATEKWTVLHLQNRRLRGIKPLAAAAKVKTLEELQFTGPKPGHPFVLGNFAVDGSWQLVDGYLQRANGKDAALQLCWANQFELEGIIEHAEFGGWFFLVGWADGHGYSISNVNFKTSGSPWFVSEMRGEKSLEDQTLEFDHFNWKGEQPFRLAVENNVLSLEVGRFSVLKTPLENYKPGAIVLGVHDTQYGPKPIRIKSLRVREIKAKVVDSAVSAPVAE